MLSLVLNIGDRPVSQETLDRRPRSHWVSGSLKGLGLMRGVMENVGWTQAELGVDPGSTASSSQEDTAMVFVHSKAAPSLLFSC